MVTQKIFAVIDTNVLVSALLRGLEERGVFGMPALIDEEMPDKKDIIFYAVTNVKHITT